MDVRILSKKNVEYQVSGDYDLIKFLGSKGYAKNKVKTYVKLGYIMVNGKVVWKLPFHGSIYDVIVIDQKDAIKSDITIAYEDQNYLVVNKEAGLLTISTSQIAKNYEDTLYRRVREYLNSKREYAFIVNRIDKETSGLVLFVKNEKLKEKLQSNWNGIVKKRSYVAVVAGNITKPGRIDNYLYEDQSTFSHSTKVGGKRAITNYRPIMRNKKYTMLDVAIETGRKNQIRVHMTEMGYPILGDKKYHSHDNPLKRLALHHYEISFFDPITGKLLSFQAEVPKEFYDLFH